VRGQLSDKLAIIYNWRWWDARAFAGRCCGAGERASAGGRSLACLVDWGFVAGNTPPPTPPRD